MIIEFYFKNRGNALAHFKIVVLKSLRWKDCTVNTIFLFYFLAFRDSVGFMAKMKFCFFVFFTYPS
jgi:hypothetical protein